MKPLKVGLVAEGFTDILLLQELINHLSEVEHNYSIIQPKSSVTEGFGKYGGGWKGVRAWCRDYRTKHVQEIEKLHLDLLIIHLDADVAREPEVDCARPCPPAQDTCEALGQCVRNWLQSVPSNLVLCLPADNMEAWVLAAFDSQTPYHQPPEQPLECVEKPDMIISNQGYKRPQRLLKRNIEGKPKKTQREYRDHLVPKVLDNWAEVIRICPQAATFEQEIGDQLKRINYRGEN